MAHEFHDVEHATEFLRGIHPFDTLGPEGLARMASSLEAAYYASGRPIFESSPPPGLAVIRKGAVRLVDSQNKFLDRRSEGELFGHEIFFRGELKHYLAKADEDCLVWHLPQEVFERFREQFPAFADYFGSHFQSRVRDAAEETHALDELRDLLKKDPVTVEESTTIRDAAGIMSRHNVSSVLVMDSGQLRGIVTDKDLRQRVLAAGVDPGVEIRQVMTANPMSLPADARVDDALMLMMRENYHHLPVVDQGRAIGLVTAGDILRAQSEHPLRVVRDIHKQTSIEGLERLSALLPSLFQRLVHLGRDVEQVGRMVTLITDAFTVRLIQLAEERWGPSPVPYAWVGFGSQAREEQTAKTDQDNGLILAEKLTGEPLEWFSRFSKFVCEGLDRLGYVYCPGDVMAMNPKWTGSLERWKKHFDGWIDQPDPKSVMHCSIFFDIRCIHGDQALVDGLQDHAVSRAKENKIFRRFLAANVLSHRPPLGFFRRFVQEHDGSRSEGLNLKHRGIVPITDLVRMRALEAGISEANTYRRIELAARAGVMNESDASSLRDALVLISRIRLNHQAAQMKAGETPGNFVPPEELSPLMRRNLKAAFMLVVEAQDALALRYQVH